MQSGMLLRSLSSSGVQLVFVRLKALKCPPAWLEQVEKAQCPDADVELTCKVALCTIALLFDCTREALQ